MSRINWSRIHREAKARGPLYDYPGETPQAYAPLEIYFQELDEYLIELERYFVTLGLRTVKGTDNMTPRGLARYRAKVRRRIAEADAIKPNRVRADFEKEYA